MFCTMTNCALPCQPLSVSNPSSSFWLDTMCLTLTVPPKNSMPSSAPPWTCTKSTVVPEPTPHSVRLLNSRSATKLNPPNSMRTYLMTPLLSVLLSPPNLPDSPSALENASNSASVLAGVDLTLTLILAAPSTSRPPQ